MKFLNSFIHGEALAEILMEGHNPYGRFKLETADIDALRQQMRAGEALQGYVVGRIVMSGRGVWAVTEQSVLLRNASHQGVEAIALDQVEGFEAVRGRFGHTVRLRAQGRGWSLFGVDRELARSMHLAFQARGIASVLEDQAALSGVWEAQLAAGPDAQDCLQDARLRLQAA
ncbi:MAG: hypothetical protein RI884_371 [Pseudomonadota bacterium]|jgi:hypothetical protein